MTTSILPAFRSREQGGLTIVMALVLIAVMGAATLSLSRNAIRELSMSGTIVQGEKAASAADAGLDWVIVWGQGGVNPADYATATAAGGQILLYDGIKKTLRSSTGYPSIKIPADTTMTIDNKGAGTATQTFDIHLWYLGTLPTGNEGSSDNNEASGNTRLGTAIGNSYWLIRSTGKSKIAGVSSPFEAQREMTASMPPIQ